jgi:hypothetical protein
MRADYQLQERDFLLLRSLPRDGFTLLGPSAEMNISTSVYLHEAPHAHAIQLFLMTSRSTLPSRAGKVEVTSFPL